MSNHQETVHSSYQLAESHHAQMQPLLEHVAENIASRTAVLEAAGHHIEVLGPDWCRDNAEEAGMLHAQAIVDAYGSTYALPNKDPAANKAALEAGTLDMYLMLVDDELTGTACLVDLGDGRAELGRSASKGKTGNTIIQDARILDWLTNPATAQRHHTLFTTLRSAPDRSIEDTTGEFVMRGGQAVTAHWRKFPGLKVNGFAPLYYKHGALEQFSCAELTRGTSDTSRKLYVAPGRISEVINSWHALYELDIPIIDSTDKSDDDMLFDAHYPTAESGLTKLVHADIVPTANSTGKSLAECINEVVEAGSPFTQVVVPIERNSIKIQWALVEAGFQTFGYEHATEHREASLLFGKVAIGKTVVPTHWDHEGTDNPFWNHPELQSFASTTAARW